MEHKTMTPSDRRRLAEIPFKILKGWKITKDRSASRLYSGQVCINEKKKTAVIYDWHNKEVPKDFYLHEYLHCALRAFSMIDKRKVKCIRQAEEDLVQDICKIWRG